MHKIEDPSRYISRRAGETRIGETLHWYSGGRFEDFLQGSHSAGCRIALIGIPESIGPVANAGAGGAEYAWEAFLSSFCSVQENRHLKGHRVAIAGTPPVAPILEKYIKTSPDDLKAIRSLVSELDAIVLQAVKPVFEAGMIPVIIGGGHNNAYPVIKAAAQACGQAIQVVNCDPHADCRQMEGRHSGNGFTYAMAEGHLSRYFVAGLHQSYNSEEMLGRMDKDPATAYSFFEDEPDPVQALKKYATDHSSHIPTGIELDMDAIVGFPASARTPVGISMQQAMAYLQYACSYYLPAYVHLPEAAPDPDGSDYKYYGKALTYLACTAIKGLSTNNKITSA
ncbi:MAG: arginase family protein [Cyclobacteriaceae bacterium]